MDATFQPTIGTPTAHLNREEFVPRPKTGLLTDAQLRRICLIAFVVLFAAAITISTIGLGLPAAIFLGVTATAYLGIATQTQLSHLWGKVDFQTPGGARKVRADLRTLGLRDLIRGDRLTCGYRTNDLAYYGYVSKRDAEYMQKLNDSMPEYVGYTPGKYCKEKVRHNELVDEARASIQEQYATQIRNKPDFIRPGPFH